MGVILAFLPAAFVGLALHSYITHYLFNAVTVAISPDHGRRSDVVD